MTNVQRIALAIWVMGGISTGYAANAPQPLPAKPPAEEPAKEAPELRGSDEEHAYSFTVGGDGESEVRAFQVPFHAAIRETKAAVECLTWKFGTIMTVSAPDAKNAKRLQQALAAYRAALAAFQAKKNPTVDTMEVEWTQMIQTQQIVYECVPSKTGFLIIAIANNRAALNKLEQLRQQDTAQFGKP